MADALITKAGRTKMVRARAGDSSLPPIVGMAFGDGGVNSSGTVLEPTESQTKLNSELLRKELDSYSFVDDYTCRYTCSLTEDELVGAKISEAGLYDSEGDLVVIKNFASKGKDSDLVMTFNLDDTF
ncbi:MAG: phage tail protein [Bacteroidales bacterium]|nr:phage tail protein [Bacteroidales bacterium]